MKVKFNPEELVPSGYTESGVLSTLHCISNRYCKKYRFGIWDDEDIYQEAYILALEGLGKFHPESGNLENFLSVHVNRRLINFKRDNYFKPEPKDLSEEDLYAWKCKHEPQKNLLEPVPLDNVYDEHERSMWSRIDFLDDQAVKEIFYILDRELPVEMRADFLRIKQGVSLPKPRREKIEEEVLRILSENGYETW